ncbi:conserved Plasmodium protein, unknown function [Plasmodium vinckei vinckei]|uniref:Uncharacterized protein n=1 Tax=Plasmodium vinckei vinckei TaxID=54757 RepID=A0A449BYC3_PLAVN|nr:conserved Plasmodium protein, unknown function [Plasmodium vinckei vinckei]KEG04658.1 hypothetical protein YYE_00233 [Plasmodium vinckei vinckei]VEV58309.1 conserved Plasmodium protein, unknown function [Plasmodium vinckei vinckei]
MRYWGTRSKHIYFFFKEEKIFHRFRSFLFTTNDDLCNKLKYNNYMIRLVKNLKKKSSDNDGEYASGNEHNENTVMSNIDAGMCYLYKDVDIIKKNIDKKETMLYNYKSNNSLINLENTQNEINEHNFNYKVITSQNNNKKKMCINNTKKVYIFIMNNLNTFTADHILLVLYSFLFNNVNVEYLRQISEHVINNIYNFKTNELLLIHLFYVYYQSDKGNSKDDYFNYNDGLLHYDIMSRCIYESNELVRNISGLDTKKELLKKIILTNFEKQNLANKNNIQINALAKNLMKYSTYLFYKRKNDLNLDQITKIYFLFTTYNVYNNEFLNHCATTFFEILKSLNLSNLKNEKVNIQNINKLHMIIQCFYYISGIAKKDTITNKTNKKIKNIYNTNIFSDFYKFIKTNFTILRHANTHHLFLLLKMIDNIDSVENGINYDSIHQCEQNENTKFIILCLIDERLKCISQYVNEYDTIKCKNIANCIKIFNHIPILYYDYYCSKFGFNNKKQMPEKDSLYFNGNHNFDVLVSSKECDKGDANLDIKTSNSDSLKMGFNELNYVHFLKKNNYFINMKNIDIKKYLSILLLAIGKTPNYKHMLTYFINNLETSTNNINLLLFYTESISTYTNNIYTLLYVDYFVKKITEQNELSNSYKIGADKIVILLSCLRNFINNKNYVDHHNFYNKMNSILDKCDFEKNSEEFFMLLYKTKPDIYDYVSQNLLTINMKNVVNLEQFLFHCSYKNMIINTFNCLKNLLFYINNTVLIYNILYLFLVINNYYNQFDANTSSVANRIAQILFQKLFILKFLNIYSDNQNAYYNVVSNIAIYIKLNKEIDEDLLKSIINIYLQNNSSPLSNNIYEQITNQLRPIYNHNFNLIYKDGTYNLSTNNEINQKDIIALIKTMIENKYDLCLINLFILFYQKANFNKLYEEIRDYLYTHVTV